MHLLVLGGTVFLGKHLVEAALAAGHRVTLFNRGRTRPELFAGREGVDAIHGDRDGGLDALAAGRWDAVVDTSGYLPRVVGASASFLAPRCGRYLFVSTISVYADPPPAGVDENGPLARLEDPAVEVVDGATYGGLKVLCEQAVNTALGARSLVVRPGLIVGPDDPTDRFSYWPLRAVRGGEILAPGGPEAPTQFIDVRDLSAWMVKLLEDEREGVYNATGPAAPLGMGGLLDACIASAGVPGQPVWVDEDFIAAQELAAFRDLPCWVPREGQGLLRTRIDRALAAGLEFRPLEVTACDTRLWREPLVEKEVLKAGLSAAREAVLLAAWREH